MLAFVILYSIGNLSAIDAFFLAVSGNTESGLNTFDVKDLNVAQQLVLYFFPVITNLCFVNIGLVVIRLLCFEKRLKNLDLKHAQSTSTRTGRNSSVPSQDVFGDFELGPMPEPEKSTPPDHANKSSQGDCSLAKLEHIRWAPEDRASEDGARRKHCLAVQQEQHDECFATQRTGNRPSKTHKPEPGLAADIERPAWIDQSSSAGVTRPGEGFDKDAMRTAEGGNTPPIIGKHSKVLTQEVSEGLEISDPRRHSASSLQTDQHVEMLPWLSRQVTVGRNSNFYGLSAKDREELGGIEYRSLKVLLKILIGLFLGLHTLGIVGLLPWIIHGPSHYRDYLASQGQDKVWWAFYSAQTMVTNLGFTLTPDSMVYFRDATWPMLLMTFLAFAGYNFHPILLRGIIWIAHKLGPSHMRESLRFLLDHPRRCYTLLFPSNVTWVLFGILFILNLVDVLLIILLDLNNEEVSSLSPASRTLAATFQAASARHTGTSTFDLADVNPAVQFSLVTMMYIAVFPIAMSVRSSNTYEERTLGIYQKDDEPDDTQRSLAYLTRHARNQLGFDLWYIFLGAFCICIAESDKIVDKSNTAFSEFAVLFECTSAYANVGLSLGAVAANTSLSGDFSVFSKLVICAMMWRGRHRGLPYDLDYAVMLPSDLDAQLESGDSGLDMSEHTPGRTSGMLKRSKTA